MYKRVVTALMTVLVSAATTQVYAASEADKVVIRHGEVSVTQNEVKQYVKMNIQPDKQDVFVSDRKRIEDTVFGMFVTRELANAARNRGLSVAEQQELNEVTARTLSKMQLDYMYEQSKKPDFARLAKETYLGKIDQFATPDSIHAEHILISTKTHSDADALALANEVLNKLKSSTKSFSDLALEYSEDPSAKNNKGDLGSFSHGKMVKPFEDAAFSLVDVGDIAGPVKTEFGYHIIKLVAKNKGRVRPFDEVSSKLIAEEKSSFRKQLVDDEVNRLKKLDGVKLDQDALSELVVNPLAHLKKD